MYLYSKSFSGIKFLFVNRFSLFFLEMFKKREILKIVISGRWTLVYGQLQNVTPLRSILMS